MVWVPREIGRDLMKMKPYEGMTPEAAALPIMCCQGSLKYPKWSGYATTWGKLVKRLRVLNRTAETEAEWTLMDKATKTQVKGQLGGWIAGDSGGGRRTVDIINRTCLVLDVDDPEPDMMQMIKNLGVECFVHQTHTPGRFRVVAPYRHPVTPEQHTEITRRAMTWLPGCDPTSAQVNRIAFWPNVCSDTVWEPRYFPGRLLDPAKLPPEWSEPAPVAPGAFGGMDTAGVLHEVRTAQPGTRNNTLSVAAWTLIMRNEFGPEIEDQLVIAALDTGMATAEIEATIDSALKAGTPAVDAKLDSMFPDDSADPDDSAPRDQGAAEAPKPRYQLEWAAGADMEEPLELWRGLLPLGSLVLISGMGGIGKSTLDAWLAAKASRGEMEGDLKGPVKTLMVMDEDDWNQDTVPRLFAAGADLSKVAKLFIHKKGGLSAVPSFPEDVSLLERVIRANGFKLVILDVITSMISAELNPNSQTDVRQLLNPLLSMSQRTGATIVCVNHWRKQSADISQMVSGSAAFRDTARCVWAVVMDREGRRFVKIDKYNRAPISGQTFEFEIQSAPIPNWRGTVGRVVNWRESDRDAQAVLDERAEPVSSEVTSVQSWLADYLMDMGETAWPVIRKAGSTDGFSEASLRTAREKLRCLNRTGPSDGAPGRPPTMWRLPTAEDLRIRNGEPFLVTDDDVEDLLQ